MDLNETQLHALENLVDELLKPTPVETRVKGFLEKAGISDPHDPVARIQSVLEALRFHQPEKEFNE
jgi:hypothetical protein